jgi:hypothetical protein
MKYYRNKCFQLLKYSQYLNDQGKSLIDESEKKYMQLLDYARRQNDHIYWENRKQYLKVMKDFVNNRFRGIEFENKFFKMFRGSKLLKTDFERLSTLEPNSKSEGFSKFIGGLISDCEVFEPEAEEGDEYNEKWLKDSVKDALLQSQKYL